MERFKRAKKGYDKIEVDKYIDSMETKLNEKLTMQMERIDMLKMELSMKDKELEKYRAKERDINEALLLAIERAKEMDYTAKIRFTLEGERIKIFRSKWINYCNKHRDNARVIAGRDEVSEYLDKMDKEIAKVLERDLGVYKNAKLSEEQEAYVEESNRRDEFNLDRLNDPPDLKEICEELENNSK